MKTDEDVRGALRRASRYVRPLDRPLDGFDRHRGRRRTRQRVAAGSIAVVVAGGLVAGGLLALNGVGTRDGTDSGLGLAPGIARSLDVGPGRYFYLRQIGLPGADDAWTDQRTWWATDGSGALRFETNRPDKYVPFPPRGTYGRGAFPIPYGNDLSSLSTDPRVLRDQLRERSGEDGASPAPEFAPDGLGLSETGRTWRAIVRLFGYPNALPQLRAALFEVAAHLPGVRVDSRTRDPFGRRSVALELRDDGAGGHWKLFFDPTTHQLMTESEAWGARPLRPIVVFESGVVDSTDGIPGRPDLLFPELRATTAVPTPASAAA
jgi:hypothetical protein